MKRYLVAWTAILGLISASVGLAAETSAAKPVAAFKTKTKSVAIFKDGYGFFLREGRARLYDGWCMTDYIPKATEGTFWLYTLESGTAVDTVRSTSRNELKFETTAELLKLLDRYTGMRISLTTASTKPEGEILRVFDDMVLVKSGEQVVVVKAADIKSAEILGEPLLIQVGCTKPVDEVTMRMGYLQAGISWVPSYTLDLLSPSQACINLRATITNCIEDISDCSIYFVVGVPNFCMKGQLDPLAAHALATATMRGIGAPPPSGGAAQTFSNNGIGESARSVTKEDHDSAAPVTSAPAESLQDMYFYEKKGLDVLAGDAVMTSVMTEKLPYRSLFVWDVNAGKAVDHYIVIKNTLAAPLTTGPVMVVQNGKPISQDVMKYISPKAEGRLRLTQATDIGTSASEKEVERKAQEMIGGYGYIPTVVEGKLVVENNRSDTAEVEIAWATGGKIIEASDKADIKSHTVTDEGLNPKTDLQCTVKIGPGQKHEVTYRYSRYVKAVAR